METLDHISVLVDDHGVVNLEVLRSFDTVTNQRTEELRIPDAFREVLDNEDDANAAGLYTLAGADDANVEHLEEDDQAQSYFEISDHTENIDPGAEQILEVAVRKEIDEGVRQILRAEATMASLPADTFDHKSQYKGWLELLMSSSSADESLRADINKFIGGLDERDFPQSLVHIEAFMADNTRKSWHTHCPHMDEDWHRLIEKIHKILPELRENEFTKPSGKNMARMATSMLVLKTVFNDYQANLNCIAGAKGSRGSCQMNYPSKNSAHLVNCHVVDPTNPSFNLQRGKMQGGPRQISTRDTIPIRNEACRSAECHWARRFGEENWRQLEELLVNFSYEHIKLSPINIILGETSFRTFLPKLLGDPLIISEQVYLNFDQKNLWRQKPSFTVIWDKASMKISNLIFYAFHPSRFFYSHPIFTGIYNDLIWNAFCELSGLGSWDVSYFVRLSAQQHDHGMIRDHLMRLFAYRAREKKTGQIFPAETIEMLFPCFLKLAPKEIQKAKKNNTSILHEIVTVIAAKGRASQEAAGNVHCRNSLAVRRASGFKELERGRATQSAAGWLSLKRGGDTHRAAGYPGLKNGRATKSAMAQDIRNAKFEALRRSVHYRKILKADKIRKAQFQEHSTSYKGVPTRGFLRRQAYWYDRDKCLNGLRYDGDGGPELDGETWDAYCDQKSIPAIVPTRVNVKQLKTEKYLEEFRAREATAMVSTRATASQTTRTAMATSQITKATVTAVTAPRTYHAMPDSAILMKFSSRMISLGTSLTSRVILLSTLPSILASSPCRQRLLTILRTMLRPIRLLYQKSVALGQIRNLG